MTANIAFEMSQLQSRIDELSRLIPSNYESSRTIQLFQYFDKIYTLCHDPTDLQILTDTLTQKNYARLCRPILEHMYTDVFKTHDRWTVIYYLLHSLWNYTDKTPSMCCAVVNEKFIHMLTFNLNHDTYLKNFISSEAIQKLFKIIVSIFHNIAQVPDLTDNLIEHKCVQMLHHIIQTVGSYDIFLKGISYLTLSYLIRESESTYLANSNESIPYLVNLLHEAILADNRRAHGLETLELCRGLSKLSVANDNKFKTFSQPKLLDSVLNMLQQHANSQEQIPACLLIWNLCFDAKVRRVYQDHQKLNEILTNMAQTSSNDELRRVASGCLCTLMGGLTTTRKSSTTEADNMTVMISYNHDTKPLIKDIKDSLAKDGFHVWIDLENMHGNLLDAMSDAIESSTIFLMCFTEKYKDSPSCRLECEYAFQKKKHIIPLLLQANYKPDGWLGLLLGTKYYINYAKKPFRTAYAETVAELQTLINRIESKSGAATTTKRAAPSVLTHLLPQLRIDKSSLEMSQVSSTNLEKMSTAETQQLLIENGFEKFMSMFVDIDGVKLMKLLEMKNKASQCYYLLLKDQWDQMNRTQALSSQEQNVSMAQFLQLTVLLDKLMDQFSPKQ